MQISQCLQEVACLSKSAEHTCALFQVLTWARNQSFQEINATSHSGFATQARESHFREAFFIQELHVVLLTQSMSALSITWKLSHDKLHITTQPRIIPNFCLCSILSPRQRPQHSAKADIAIVGPAFVQVLQVA